jgi:FHA domain
VGFFDRFVSKGKREGRRAKAARERENAGDLGAAVELYTEAGLADDAARVLLLRADAELSVERRIAFCALAADRAESEELRRKARGRKALCAFDTLRRSGGAFLESEVLAVARELEEAGELERAADAYALGGDPESEVRVLTAAGAIERIEERFRASERATRGEREIEHTLRRIADLDHTAERRAALELCKKAMTTRDDPRIAEAARAIRARLVRGPVVDLEIDGDLRRYALGAEVTIGRGDATIAIGSKAVSRRHLRIGRTADARSGAFVEDLDTRNGTLLAGARIAGRIPVGDGVRLVLGGGVPCAVEPIFLSADEPTPLGHVEGGYYAVEIAGWRYVLPLGSLSIGGFRIGLDFAQNESYLVLTSPEQSGAGTAPRPYLGDYQLASRVELCHGDEIRAVRGGPVCLRVPAARPEAPGDDETDVFRSYEP